MKIRSTRDIAFPCFLLSGFSLHTAKFMRKSISFLGLLGQTNVLNVTEATVNLRLQFTLIKIEMFILLDCNSVQAASSPSFYKSLGTENAQAFRVVLIKAPSGQRHP